MTEEKIKTFAKDFLFRTGLDLEKRLPANDLETNKVDAFVNRIEMMIEEEIKTRNPNYAIWKARGLSEVQEDAIYRAILEQAAYVFVVGDMNFISGYDPVSGNITPLNEIRKRQFSPMAIKILTNVGLFYSGIGNRTRGGYLEERDRWC